MAVKYSTVDKQQMRTAFTRLFNVNRELCDQPSIIEWMEAAPIGCIEDDRMFPGEDAKGRDIRMEMISVYDGDIHELVEYLRALRPDDSSLTKWEIIFKTYSELVDATKAIQLARTQQVFGETPVNGATDEPHEDGFQRELDTSNEVVSNETQSVSAEPVITQENAKEESIQKQVEPVVDIQVDEDSRVKLPSGKVEDAEVQPLTHTSNIQYKEEKQNMADMDVNKLMDAANAAGGVQDPTAVQNPGGVTGATTKPKAPEIGADYLKAATEQYEQTLEERIEWTRLNTVDQLIGANEPVAMRIPDGAVGTITTNDGGAEKRVADFIAKFEKAVGNTIDNMQDKSPAEKFPNVPDSINRQRAEAVLQLLLQLQNDPKKALPVYKAEKVSVPVKGYYIKGAKYNNPEFRDLLLLKSSGAAYATDSIKDGAVIAEGAVFILSVVQKKASVGNAAKGSEPTTDQKKEEIKGWDGSIRPRNKDVMLKANKIVYIYPTIAMTPENAVSAPAKAAITVAGSDKVVPAVFKYYLTDAEGNFETKTVTRKSRKDQTVKSETVKVTKLFSLVLRTQAAPTATDPIDEFKTDFSKFVRSDGRGAREAINYISAESIKAASVKVNKDGSETSVPNAIERLLAAASQGVTVSEVSAEVKNVTNSLKAGVSNAQAAANQQDAEDIL